jgi:hypothetical protein
MENLFIRNTNVVFPFPPYQSQLVFMERVIEALQLSQVSICLNPLFFWRSFLC